MIDVERLNALQDAIAENVDARSAGLVSRKRDTKLKKGNNFRIFDSDIILVGDGLAKLHVAFVINLQSAEAFLEAQFNQTGGRALAYDEWNAAYKNNASEISLALDFVDPLEAGEGLRTQQKIQWKIQGYDYHSEEVWQLAEATAEMMCQFHDTLRQMNKLARAQ